MKLIVVLPTDRIGGAERVCMTFVEEALKSSDISEISLYIMSRGRSGGWSKLEEHPKLSIFYCEARSEKTALAPLVRYLQGQGQADIVYSTHVHINAFLSLLRRLKVLKTRYLIGRESSVFSDRGTAFHRAVFSFLYKFYSAHDLLICQTDYMKQRLVSTRGSAIAKRITVIGNPVDSEFISARALLAVKSDRNAELLAAPKALRIVVVGRLVALKNHKLLLDSLSLLPSESRNDLEVKFVGDGPLKNELMAHATRLNLCEVVNFVGQVSNPFPYMREANMGILCSKLEGFPNVVLEMMACGVPQIICTPCTPALNDIPNIMVLDGFDPVELASRIEKAFDQRGVIAVDHAEFLSTRRPKAFYSQILVEAQIAVN